MPRLSRFPHFAEPTLGLRLILKYGDGFLQPAPATPFHLAVLSPTMAVDASLVSIKQIQASSPALYSGWSHPL